VTMNSVRMLNWNMHPVVTHGPQYVACPLSAEANSPLNSEEQRPLP
jgi:hypothetical protein